MEFLSSVPTDVYVILTMETKDARLIVKRLPRTSASPESRRGRAHSYIWAQTEMNRKHQAHYSQSWHSRASSLSISLSPAAAAAARLARRWRREIPDVWLKISWDRGKRYATRGRLVVVPWGYKARTTARRAIGIERKGIGRGDGGEALWASDPRPIEPVALFTAFRHFSRSLRQAFFRDASPALRAFILIRWVIPRAESGHSFRIGGRV